MAINEKLLEKKEKTRLEKLAEAQTDFDKFKTLYYHFLSELPAPTDSKYKELNEKCEYYRERVLRYAFELGQLNHRKDVV